MIGGLECEELRCVASATYSRPLTVARTGASGKPSGADPATVIAQRRDHRGTVVLGNGRAQREVEREYLHIVGDTRGYIVELARERLARDHQFLLALDNQLAARHFVDQDRGENLQDRQRSDEERCQA